MRSHSHTKRTADTSTGVSAVSRVRACACALGLLLSAAFLSVPRMRAAENAAPHASVDRSGAVFTSDGLTLHLNADLGSIKVETLPPNASPMVRYSVHIETDAREPLAEALLDKYALAAHATSAGVVLTGSIPSLRVSAGKNAQFWVQFVVTVPNNYNVDVTTGGGDIETSDLCGHVVLKTQGGNIRTGRVTLPSAQRSGANTNDSLLAKLETQGGHITVTDVSGDLDAFTAGGHIQAGNIEGNAKLQTGGGHIRAGKIKGTARLETDGGNIAVGEADSPVAVHTGGGQIDFGEVHGSIHAGTAGGGIRAMYVAGPMEVETSGGSICLTRVVNTVRAGTDGGTIRAWITPDSHDLNRVVRLPGPSQLASGTGDILVYLPRNIEATIDATVETGGTSHISADPSLPLNVQVNADGMVHALGILNGGGGLLKLRTTAGKIRLQYVDAETALRQSLLEEQKRRLAEKLSDTSFEKQIALRPLVPPSAAPIEKKGDWIDMMRDQLEVLIWGGLREDPEEFKKLLLSHPDPEYPALARRAGIQGVVRLQLRMKPDGTVIVDKVLEGQPALVDAAVNAVRQWRACPEQFKGKRVEVISTIAFNFHLR